MVNFCIKLILSIFIFGCIQISHSQQLINFQYDVLLNLTTNTNQVSNYPFNNTLNYINFCDNVVFYCFQPNSNELVLYEINYSNLGNTNYVLKGSDFVNLEKIDKLKLTGFTIDSFFISQTLQFTQNLTLIDNTILGLLGDISSNVEIIQNTIPLNLTVNLSQFSSNLHTEFSLLETENSNLINFNLINDVNSNDPLSIYKLYVTINDIPDLTNVQVEELSLYINNHFSATPNYNILATITQVQYFSFICYSPINLQFAPFHGMTSSQMQCFSIYSCNFLSVPSNISFTGLTALQSFDITDTYLSFSNKNNTGLIPMTFSKSVTGFGYVGGNLTNFNDLSKFYNLYNVALQNNNMNSNLPSFDPYQSSISQLNLGFNGLTGTIGEEWCGMSNLFINNNSLSGVIPNCFKCYWDVFVYNFRGNPGLTNYDIDEECTSFVPNVYLNKQEGYLYVFGSSLGFFNYPFIVEPDTTQFFECYTIHTNEKFKCVYYPDKPYPKLLNLLSSQNNQTYTFAVDPTKPLVTNVNTTGIYGDTFSYTLSGSYFSYNKSAIEIRVDGEFCEITKNYDTTFYSMNCTTVSNGVKQVPAINGVPLPSYLKVITVTIGDQVQTFTINQDYFVNPVIQCKEQCGGYCNYQLGVCVSNCPEPTCNNNGKCNESEGVCSCDVKYIGDNCTIANQYASSVSPASSQQGGNVTIGGWFGTINNDLSVLIGNQNCNVSFINNETIICAIGPLTPGYINLTITQNGNTWFDSDYYILNPDILSCLNNCSNINGACNTSNGQCRCKSGWYGLDCSSPFNPNGNNNGVPTTPTNTTVNNNGSTSIINSKTNYQISIPTLLEKDINNQIVLTYQLNNNWRLNETKSNIYIFQQQIQQSSGNKFSISYMIEEIQESKDYTFAGYDLSLDKGSIKISVAINNYEYQSSLNSLQLQFNSSVQINEDNDCNEKDTSINDSNQQLLNYINIQKDSKTLQARFLNRIISDGRATAITSEVVSINDNSIIVGLNLPHCSNCLIDPDFSVLLSPDFKTSCSDDSKRDAYVIPVAVVCSVVGVSAIGVIAYFIYKKKQDDKLFRTLSLKTKSLK